MRKTDEQRIRDFYTGWASDEVAARPNTTRRELTARVNELCAAPGATDRALKALSLVEPEAAPAATSDTPKPTSTRARRDAKKPSA